MVKKILSNFKFLLSYCIAYIIVNGWSYVFVAIGYVFNITWLFTTGITWLTILWMPNGVCFIVTIPPAILIHWWLFKDKIKLHKEETRKMKIITKKGTY